MTENETRYFKMFFHAIVAGAIAGLIAFVANPATPNMPVIFAGVGIAACKDIIAYLGTPPEAKEIAH